MLGQEKKNFKKKLPKKYLKNNTKENIRSRESRKNVNAYSRTILKLGERIPHLGI